MTLIKNFKKVWQTILAEEKTKSFYLVILMLFSVVFETLSVGLIVPFITYLVEPSFIINLQKYIPFDINLEEIPELLFLTYSMLFLAFFFLIKNLYLSYFVWEQYKFTTDIRISLSRRLFNKYLFDEYKFHLDNNSSILVKNVYQEATRFMTTLSASLTIFAEIFVIIGLAVLLLIIEPFGLIASVSIMGLAAYLMYYLSRTFLHSWSKIRVFNEGEMLKHLMQGLAGIKDIKILNREQSFMNSFDIHNSKFSIADRWYNTVKFLPRLWLEFLAVVMLVIIVILMKTTGKDNTFIIPVIAAFSASAFRIIPSMNRILTSLMVFRYSLPSIGIVYDELNKTDEINNSKKFNHVEKISFNNQILLDSVFFSYEKEDSPTLENIKFEIKKNQFIGIVGPSGAGKSTLVDLILGLLKPDRGKVLVDGNDIHMLNRSWQKIIGYVPQDIYLTDDSIKKNIALGLNDNEIDEILINKCIIAAQLEKFIEQLDNGLDTFVGERGVRISGGQLQRIGIARALYNRPLILVLDEATSSLDIETEKKVMDGINQLKGSMTIISISHRLSTVKDCDKIITIDNGKII